MAVRLAVIVALSLVASFAAKPRRVVTSSSASFTAKPAGVGGSVEHKRGAEERIHSISLQQKFFTEHGVQAKATDAEVNFTAVIAEYIAMTLFVIIGCGSAMMVAGEPAWVLQVALAFGLAISSLAYAIGHYSGGQINCAVTLAMVVSGQINKLQGVANFAAQMLGSITGALILTAICPEDKDKSGGLGCNCIPQGRTFNAFTGEVTMTFLLVFVIFETSVNPAAEANSVMACLAIGFAVFLAHSVLIPLDGCSINPTRSFGPAIVRKFVYKNSGSMSDQWVFWFAPLLGAVCGAGVSLFVSSLPG